MGRSSLARLDLPPGSEVEQRVQKAHKQAKLALGELRELIRVRRSPGDATDRRLAAAASVADLREVARRRAPRRSG